MTAHQIRTVTLTCDVCGDTRQDNSTARINTARKHAASYGWTRLGDSDTCPRCTEWAQLAADRALAAKVAALDSRGDMTGLPEYNYPAFHAAAKALLVKGYDAIIPAREMVEGWEWADYMRRGLTAMLTCDAVALLPGWEQSRGALLEHHVAIELGMPTKPLDSWLEWGDR